MERTSAQSAETTLQILDKIRLRIFEDGDYEALNNFSGNLPGGFRREIDPEDVLFIEIDRAINVVGTDPEVIEAFNLAKTLLGMELLDKRTERLLDSYQRMSLALAKYVFPVYEYLIQQGRYSHSDLRA